MVRTGDYSLGKLYKLVSNQTEDVYIGSTSQILLSKQLYGHKQHYTCWAEGKENEHYMTSYEILKHGDAQIILIENYPCNDKSELEARERYHIENNKCVNKTIPTRTHNERCIINKERINQKEKEWRLLNKENVRQSKKAYRERHKEYIKQWLSNYYQNNKDKISEERKERVVCPICGLSSTKPNLPRHQKTKKCQSFLQNKEPEKEQSP